MKHGVELIFVDVLPHEDIVDKDQIKVVVYAKQSRLLNSNKNVISCIN